MASDSNSDEGYKISFFNKEGQSHRLEGPSVETVLPGSGWYHVWSINGNEITTYVEQISDDSYLYNILKIFYVELVKNGDKTLYDLKDYVNLHFKNGYISEIQRDKGHNLINYWIENKSKRT